MKIDFNKLNQTQISNLEVALNTYNNKELISSGSPPVLYIELTQNCIARCVFCKKNWKNSPSYNMDDRTFDILLREYIPYAVLVDLRSVGESLMLPDFDQYVHKVARFGPKIRITTTLGCDNPKAIQSLIDNDVFVSISIDAADKRLYESIRKGISYDVVIKNLDMLTRGMLEKYGTLQDRVRFGIVPLQRRNLDYVEGLIQLAIKYRIPEIRIGPLVSAPWDFNLLKYNKRKTMEIICKCIEYSKEAGIKFQLANPPFKELYIQDKSFDRCCHPWLYVQINYKGDVFFCDRIFSSEFIAGNINKENKEAIWNGIKAQEYRLAHISKKMEKLPRECRDCYNFGRYSDHEHEIDKQFNKWLVTEEDMEGKLSQKKIFKIFNK